MESLSSASSPIKATYQRIVAAAESVWTAPLFGTKKEALPHSHSFEAALKDSAYVPEHLKPILLAQKAAAEEADPVSVIQEDACSSKSSCSETQSTAPDSPRAEPAAPAAPVRCQVAGAAAKPKTKRRLPVRRMAVAVVVVAAGAALGIRRRAEKKRT